MENLPPIPKLENLMEVRQKIEFEIEYEGERYMFAYDIKIEADFNSKKEIIIDCLEEQCLPETWE
ncbi:hypothetical protein CMO90_01625 [Candidatus Woesearchaeota archaeon]|jgi:hypothetical protein|nr:hypothetical protein [Candidatus Woesearchaeota archaeon]|tara:strand:- start:2942 stop:3136 length:195 start_codon:yes stop_codon:yes gene_type:complete